MAMLASLSARTAFAAVLLLVVFRPLVAQDMLGGMGGEGIGSRAFRIAVNGGMSVPSGDFKFKNANGFHYGAMLVVPVPGLRVALRPEVTVTQYRIKKPFSRTPVYGDFKNTNTISGLGNIEVPLAAGLYAIAGGGVLRIKSDTADTGEPLSAANVMYDVGGGYRFRLGEHIDGYLEARVGVASFDKNKFGYAKAQFVPLTFGLVF